MDVRFRDIKWTYDSGTGAEIRAGDVKFGDVAIIAGN